VVNRSAETQKVQLRLNTHGPAGLVTTLRGETPSSISERLIELMVEERDASILKWRK
jgi:hypothetical protein